MIENIHWLGHASFYMNLGLNLYIDPWRISAQAHYPPADVILLTHEHYDHFSPSDIERLTTPSTQIITNQRVASLLDDVTDMGPIVVLRHWQSVNIGAINVKATPAYTFDGYHPPAREDLGFVIAYQHHDIYYAGDTDFVADLRHLRCDVAILPVGAKSGLMTIEESVRFVKSLRPIWVIPSHYGTSQGGSLLDAKALETALQGVAPVAWLNAVV
jgi:L-ascorbate metabolism protein UlaG (beta-lactamase superfamily)